MKTLSDEEFQRIIEAGYETRNLEFKPPFSWNDKEKLWFREKVIQTILGMSNTQDGGNIVIGVSEKDNQLEFVGITEDQLATFIYDDIKGVVDGFASSSSSFDIAQASYEDNSYLVIGVSEFEEMPIICKNDGYKDSQGNYLLRRGNIYSRSRSGQAGTKPETEMREIIEIAVDKNQRRLLRRGWTYPIEEDNELFAKQREDF